jgi:hypothetical protein
VICIKEVEKKRDPDGICSYMAALVLVYLLCGPGRRNNNEHSKIQQCSAGGNHIVILAVSHPPHSIAIGTL